MAQSRPSFHARCALGLALTLALIVPYSGAASAAPIAVTTYHYDALRTGWNHLETQLSAHTFPADFGLLATVAVDDQVDAQPLLLPAQTIAGGTHDVLYVVTEHNSVYALDAQTGQVLVTRNLGTPVPTPLGCNNNGPNVGITGTPVLDTIRHRLYVIAYVNGSPPKYQLHALDPVTLTDVLTPVTVAATQKLTDGSTFAFNATYQRQRPGLLLNHGVLYAAFGSFCDFQANHSRGWVIGWKMPNLNPLPSAELNDTQATSPTSFFLSSVWMSGFGLATNGTAVFFSTGNSDCNFYVNPENCPAQTTYDGVTNLQESVVALQMNLSARAGVFTPSNVFQMDIGDADLGASGVLLLPTQPDGSNLAAIVSKDGRLFLLNQSDLSHALDTKQLGDGCWCGATYFRGHDGVGRVVTTAGTLQTWQVVTSPTPHWVAESSTSTVPGSEQDPGFFTVVTSHGVQANSMIIWAVGRPTSTTGLVLYAFAATPVNGSLKLLFSAPAGSWPNLGGNANVVPMVANGRAYVAAYQTVMIFGAGGSSASAVPSMSEDLALPAGTSRITGTLLSLEGSAMVLITRSGERVPVEAAQAMARQRSTRLVIGQAYTVIAPAVAAGSSLQAASISRAKPGMAAWPADQ
ncbi:MAG TPA: hypothetical protein VMG33_13070 [Steroidobacteraceae bacterium]|nr:hypothetical protein [Steroidobacteraceae bacterium]